MTEARMQETPQYAPGTFCWVELGTSDGEGAKKFYTELFGWDYTDNPIGPGMVYTMLKQDGKDVGALYQLSPEMIGQGIPPHWLSCKIQREQCLLYGSRANTRAQAS